MSVAPLSELFDERTILMPVTVDQYHQMIESGIIPEGEPYELLEGHVVRKDRSAAGEDPMTVGKSHSYVVMRLTALGPKLEPLGCHLRPQQPILLPSRNEPEPDAAIVVGEIDRYRDRLPETPDVTCVIEVADASLRRDRNIKQRIYAEAGLECYIIINLIDCVAEVHTQPRTTEQRYVVREVIPANQDLVLPVAGGKSLPVPLMRLLP